MFKQQLELTGDLELIENYRYDKTQNKWGIVYEKSALEDIKKDSVSFLTWNVWFERHNFDERGVEIRELIEKYNPDFVCLQEVTMPFHNKLLECEWVRDRYYVSGYGKFRSAYETLILSRYKCNFYKRLFPTEMGRNLRLAEIKLNGSNMAVGTVHLESMDNATYREIQMKICFEMLSAYDEAFLMGDFNFDWKSENDKIDKTYLDIGEILNNHGKENFTMPKNEKYPAWRPDRILQKKSENLAARSIIRIGMDSIKLYRENPELKKDVAVVTPSDHYGLYATFEMTAKPTQLVLAWCDPEIDNPENSKYTQRINELYNDKVMALFEKSVYRVEKIIGGINNERFILILNSTVCEELVAKHPDDFSKFVANHRNVVIVFTSQERLGSTLKLLGEKELGEVSVVTQFAEILKALDDYLSSHKSLSEL